jgi:hypothetical protein
LFSPLSALSFSFSFSEYYEEDLADVLGENYLRREMLDVDFGDAKDQATKTVRGFEMYKSVRRQSVAVLFLAIFMMLCVFISMFYFVFLLLVFCIRHIHHSFLPFHLLYPLLDSLFIP